MDRTRWPHTGSAVCPVLSSSAFELTWEPLCDYLSNVICRRGQQGWRAAGQSWYLVSSEQDTELRLALSYHKTHHCLLLLPLPFQVTEPASEVPDHIRPNHLIKELTKEIRHVEVISFGTLDRLHFNHKQSITDWLIITPLIFCIFTYRICMWVYKKYIYFH